MNGTGTGRANGAAVGLTVFASAIMILVGIFQAVDGFIALRSDPLLAVTGTWAFALDSTTWGWIHLILGVLVALAGGALLRGAVWARTVGVFLVGMSAVAMFLWLPYYPVWAALVIALDVLVIWALTAHGRDVTLR